MVHFDSPESHFGKKNLIERFDSFIQLMSHCRRNVLRKISEKAGIRSQYVV